MASAALDYTIVIPTIGRAGLTAVLRAVDRSQGTAPAEIVVVDDRPPGPAGAAAPLTVPGMGITLRVVEGVPARRVERPQRHIAQLLVRKKTNET